MKFRKILVNTTGWLQVVGGVSGLIMLIELLLQAEALNGALLIIFLTGLSLFIFSILTGLILFFRANKKVGLILTIINQVIQIVQWKFLGYGLSYSSGAELLIGYNKGAIHFNFQIIRSTFIMAIRSNPEFYFSLNLLSIIILIFSINILNKIPSGTVSGSASSM